MAYIGATLIGLWFRLVPRRMRFRLAITISRLLAPLATRAHAMPADQMARVLARAMMWTRTRYDPRPRIDAPADVIETVARSGAIFVTGHFPLGWMLARYLFDNGLWPAIVKALPDADPFIWGTAVPDEVIVPAPTFLIRVRTILAEKRPVIMAIDSNGPREFATPLGTRNVSTVSFDFARKLGVPMFFACVRLARKGEPLIYIRRIEPTVEAYVEQYREALRVPV